MRVRQVAVIAEPHAEWRVRAQARVHTDVRPLPCDDACPTMAYGCVVCSMRNAARHDSSKEGWCRNRIAMHGHCTTGASLLSQHCE